MTSNGKNRKNSVIWVNQSKNSKGVCPAVSDSTRYFANGPKKPVDDYDIKLAKHGVKVARKIASCLGSSVGK